MTEALAAEIGIEGVFYASILFVAAISCFWPWWRSQLGWTIAAKSIALAIVTLPTMIFYWYGGHDHAGHGPSWLRAVSTAALWAVPVILVWRGYVLFHIQRQGMTPK